jgi:hypothetical protein
MTMSLDAAAQVMREAMREKVKRHLFWYLVRRSDDCRWHSGTGLSSSPRNYC